MRALKTSLRTILVIASSLPLILNNVFIAFAQDPSDPELPDSPYKIFLPVTLNSYGNYYSANPGCPASDNYWQNTCSDPDFTWSTGGYAPSDGVGHFVYWGIDATGTATYFTTNLNYNPAPVDNPSVHYLRTQSKDKDGNLGEWKTRFVFKFDAKAPSNPSSLYSASHIPGVRHQPGISPAGSQRGWCNGD